MNGKKANIHKNDFLKLADTCGISHSTADKLMKNLIKHVPHLLVMCDESYLPAELKERVAKIISERSEVFR